MNILLLIWNLFENNWSGNRSLTKLDANIIQVPKWAEGTNLRTALLKQCYMPPDLDQIFATVEMPDLSSMFVEQRKRFLLQFTFFTIIQGGFLLFRPKKCVKLHVNTFKKVLSVKIA